MKLTLVLRTEHKLKGGRHPLTLRLNIGDEKRYYPVEHLGQPVRLTGSEYTSLMETKHPRGDNRALKESVERAKREAEGIIDHKGDFKAKTFQSFEALFLKKTRSTLLGEFDRYLQELLADPNDRAGTWRSYQTTRNLWQRHFPKEFDLIETLEKLEGFAGKIPGATSRAIHLRQTRAVYNRARKRLKFLPPWDFKIGAGSDSPKAIALNESQLRVFQNGQPENSKENEAKRLFLVSLYAGGANFADILCWNESNVVDGIHGKEIVFVRKKTKRTGRQNSIPITPSLTGVLYPFIGLKSTGKTLKNQISSIIKETNESLASYCKRLSIPVVTTYSARHTFASYLKVQGTEEILISKLLGHRDVKTTQSYLKSISYEQEKRAAMMKLSA